ncbi:MAG: glycosyltransferase family 2 protein [Patescibacteria group bacterium]
MYQKLPTISIVIPTLNEAVYIEECLKSVFRQNYPLNKLEVFIVDGGSSDNTLSIAKKYPVKILFNKEKDAQIGRMLGLKKSKGDFYIYLDADIRLRGKNWFNKMIKPLLEDEKIVASVSCYYSKKDDSWLTRFITYDIKQRDPIYEFFSPNITSTIQEKRNGYFLCNYTKNKIPPSGRCLFRTKVLKNSFIYKRKKFMELDNLAILVSEGYTFFGFVPEAGFYHNFVLGLGELLRKRYRNIKQNFLFQEEGRYYKWFDLHKISDVLKILLWLFYVHLFFPSLIRGIYKTLKHRDAICLVEPFLNILETYIILYGFAYVYASTYFNKFKMYILKSE